MKFNFNTCNLKNINGYNDKNYIENFYIQDVSSLNNPKNNSILFINTVDSAIIEKITSLINCVIITCRGTESNYYDISKRNIVLYVENPRREFAIILEYILKNSVTNREYRNIQNNIVLGKNTRIGTNTIIEPNVFIENDVVIGENCTIMSGTVIKQYVTIGDNTVIRENSVIGCAGYGIERDLNGFTIRIPHLGGVVIGSNVDIGSLTAIASGTIDPTIISDFVKIDNLVHIAHNCIIGRGSMIIACAEVSGSTEIGENVWVAPNVSIINKTKIGSNSTIGIGAVVIKDVPEGAVVTGNPADSLENLKKFNKIKKKLISEYK